MMELAQTDVIEPAHVLACILASYVLAGAYRHSAAL